MENTEHDPEKSAVQKLLHLDEGRHIVYFTKEEAQALKKIAEYYLGFQAVGRFSAGFRAVVMWVGWLVLTYFLIKNGFLEWVRAQSR